MRGASGRCRKVEGVTSLGDEAASVGFTRAQRVTTLVEQRDVAQRYHTAGRSRWQWAELWRLLVVSRGNEGVDGTWS
jgi:hypothetical protein